MRLPLLAAGLLLAGCFGPPPDDGSGGDDAPAEVAAPWWPVGAWWEVKIERAGRTDHVRLVNFLNASDHFWLGVDDRAVAMDHALHDTNPLLGRIHWGYLTPHEKASHANAMFTFPMSPGETWEGNLLGRTWTLTARAGATPGSLAVTGGASDGATIVYDYDPDAMWFTTLEVKKGSAVETRFTVTDFGLGADGAYWFLRGRDYYEGPKGGLEDMFNVCSGPTGNGPCKEEMDVRSLVAEFDATFAGPGRVEFVDPSGAVKKEVTVTGGAVKQIVEIPNPAPGTWKVRYVGTGVPQGSIDGTGILEYAASL